MPGDADRELKYACLSCRQRKLKCDRKFPCANCTARDVDCKQQSFGAPATRSRGVVKHHQQTTTSTSAPSMSDVLARLERIEALVNHTNGIGDIPIAESSPPSGDFHISGDHQIAGNSARQPKVAQNWNEVNLQTEIQTTGVGFSLRNESGKLASISTSDDILNAALSSDISLSVCSSNPPTPGSSTDFTRRHSYVIELPPKEETLRLFGIYLNYVHHFHRIIFEPHTRSLIEQIYQHASIHSNRNPPNGIALLFSILSIASLLAPSQLQAQASPAIDVRSRLSVAAVYLKVAMNCLDQARRCMNHTLEDVQALIILSFLIHHIEAFSARSRILTAEAIAAARILGLHRIDAPANKRSQADETNPIVKEIKRRVWWYLASTDWITSLAGGPGDCFYSIEPKHMTVNIPLNINDEDLAAENFVERPTSEPTHMSYVLQRLKIAMVAREFSNMVPIDPSDATFDLILSLDAQVEEFIRELPAFFDITKTNTEEVKMLDKKYTYIPIQRLIITMILSLGRCKLHLHYLVGSPDLALHRFSREVCLKSARMALLAHKELNTLDLSHSSDFMKVQGTVHHLFLVAIILATDLCCNRPTGKERDRSSDELMRACEVLASVKNESQVAAKFLDCLTGLLVRYGVWSANTVSVERDMSAASVMGAATPHLEQRLPVQNATTTNNVQEDNFSQQWMYEQQEYWEKPGSELPMQFNDLWDTYVGQQSSMELIDLFG